MKRLVCLLLMLLGLAPFVQAQFETAAVLGTVRDQTGSVVDGAEVVLVSPATGIRTVRQTDENGDYIFPAVRPGTYSIEVAHVGFSKALVSDIVVTTGTRRRVDVALSVTQVADTVTVSGTVAMLETDSSQRGQLVSAQQAVELPLNGREYSQLVLLTAGTRQSAVGTGSVSTNREGSFNVNGLRSTFNNFLLDGLDNNAYGTSNQGFSNQVIQPSPDSIAEFQVVTNNESAEYGRAAGATINTSFRSGTNAFHGTLYEFVRNTDLNAVGFFKPPNGRNPQFNRNQFGGTLGGPIVKEKGFFFLDYEGFRQARGILATSTIPTLAQRNGILAVSVFDPFTGVNYPAGTQIPASVLSPAVVKIIAGLPQPTNSASSNNYQIVQKFTNNTDKYDAKFDYHANDRLSGFARLSQRKANLTDFPSIPLPSGGGGNGRINVLNQQVVAGATWTISNTKLLELRMGFSRTRGGKSPLTVGLPSALDLYGIPGLPTDPRISGGLPTEQISGFSDLGRQATNPQWQYPSDYNPKVNFTNVLRRHTLKFGYEYQAISTTVQDVNPLYGRDAYAGGFSRYPTGVRGTLPAIANSSAYNFADFLFGARSQFALSTFFIARVRQGQHYGYVQDDWKVTPKLTLNLGMRYEYASPLTEAQNHLTNYDPVTNSILTAKDGSISDRALVDPDLNNFGPRLGFAYAPDGKTAIRGGFGVAFVHYDRAGAGNLLPINGPQVVNAVVNQVNPRDPNFRTLDQGFPAGLASPASFNPLVANITYVPRNYRTSYVESYFLSVQREVFKNTLVDVAYVGNQAHKLLLFANFNQAHPFTTGTLATNRPIPGFADITYAFNGGASNYNSLQVRLEHRAGSGLSFLNSFTWSHAIDNGSGSLENPNGNFPAPQDFYNLPADRANSAYDQPITNITSLVYELPFGHGQRLLGNAPAYLDALAGGWEISLINQYSSGQPLTVTYNPAASILVSGIQQDFRGANNYRPNLVGNPVLAGGGPEAGLPYLDATAFKVPTGTPFGNAGRNIAFGPAFNQLDFAANKSFRLPIENLRLQFRTEIFNLFNHTNFLPPNTNFSSGSFGKITNTFDPRLIQFGLKLSF